MVRSEEKLPTIAEDLQMDQHIISIDDESLTPTNEEVSKDETNLPYLTEPPT
jgi:hypothetical protein